MTKSCSSYLLVTLFVFLLRMINWFDKKTVSWQSYLGPIHTYPFLYESPIWPTVHTYLVKTVTEKRIFSKALLWVEIFEKAILLHSCGWMKTVFENDYVIVLDTSKCACSHQRRYTPFSNTIAFFNSTFSHRPQCTLLSPLKFCITMVFFFSWDDCIGKNDYAKFWGDKQGALWSV